MIRFGYVDTVGNRTRSSLISATLAVSIVNTIETVYDELGRSWVYIPDELWECRETCEWAFGFPIFVTQYKH